MSDLLRINLIGEQVLIKYTIKCTMSLSYLLQALARIQTLNLQYDKLLYKYIYNIIQSSNIIRMN